MILQEDKGMKSGIKQIKTARGLERLEVVAWDICLRTWKKWTFRLKDEIHREKKNAQKKQKKSG